MPIYILLNIILPEAFHASIVFFFGKFSVNIFVIHSNLSYNVRFQCMAKVKRLNDLWPINQKTTLISNTTLA